LPAETNSLAKVKRYQRRAFSRRAHPGDQLQKLTKAGKDGARRRPNSQKLCRVVMNRWGEKNQGFGKRMIYGDAAEAR
jgi:hypothetical protein